MNKFARLFWLISIAFCILLVAGWGWLRGDVPWLPGNSAWRWPYELPRWQWVLPCILGVALYTAGAIYLIYRDTRLNSTGYPKHLILWAFVGAALLPLLMMTLEGSPLFLLFTRSASAVVGGYQYAGIRITDLNATLRNWPQFVLDYREKTPLGGIALSPPGLAVMYYSAIKFFETFPALGHSFGALVRPLECQNLDMTQWSDAGMASAWVQMAMPLWAALTVAPLYKLGKMLFNRRVALWAVIVWPLVPGFVLFEPRFNTFYTLMSLVMLVTLWQGLLRKRWWWVFAAGFVISVALFLNLSLVPLGLLAGLTIIGYWLFKGITFRQLIVAMVTLGFGTASVWIIYWLLSGTTIFDIYRFALKLHLVHNRPYFPWLGMHTYDTFLFAGIPVAILSIWRIFASRSVKTLGNVFALVGGLTLLIMVLSGTAQGETGRVWLFFAPIWVLLSADALQSLSKPNKVVFVAMQALCMLCMAAVIRGNFTALTVPPLPPTAVQAPEIPINARFVNGNDAVTLVGVSLDRTPLELTMHFQWRADSFVRDAYALSLVRVPPDGAYMDSVTWNPYNWEYPPSCWMPGQVFEDTVKVPLGDVPKPGDWQFSLGMVGVFTHQSVTVIMPDGQTTNQVGIAPVKIPAP